MVKDVNDEKEAVFSLPFEGEKVVVKFKKDAGIRLSGTEFASIAQADVTGLQNILKKYPDITVERTFDETEDMLEEETARLAKELGEAAPSLSGYYNITIGKRKQAETICAELQKNPLVEEAYVEPPAVPALFSEPAAVSEEEAPPATPDFISRQGYLNAAPDGVDARFAWTKSGGKGNKVQVIDIEGAWNFSHEDLLMSQGGVVGGTPTSNLDWKNHGTAVQGEIGGDENGIGVVGIAPLSRFSAVSIFGSGNSTAKAIKTAADRLKKGNIILIELHRAGPGASGQGQDGYIAIEWWSADFNAVKYATAKGIIVIAAAGNGSRHLDDPIYQKKFDRSFRDSGSIIVGAGAPPSGHYGTDRSRLSFSNYGSIVDAQGWGREVTTTGYKDLQGGSNKNKWYTAHFSGTSSASPIVVGAIACLQSIVVTRGDAPLSYTKVREVLRKTGSPQTHSPGRPKTQRIGNRPDIKAALAHLLPSKVLSGIATKYWDECVSYPPGSTASLWLYVNGWKNLDNPSQGIKDMVQRAFLGSGSNVRVWYDGSKVVGLVVEGT